MKHQLFFVFYEEDKNNDIYSKLIKTYLNRFIIDEDAENDVMSVHILEKYHEIDYSQSGLFKKMKLLYYLRFRPELRNNFYAMFHEAIRSFKDIDDIDSIPVHFLIGTSMNEYDVFLITTLYGTQIDSTVLSGSHKVVEQPPKIDKSNITIGDDMDLLIDSSVSDDTESRNSIWQTYFTKTMISYELLVRSDLDKEFYKVFKCKRNFFPRLSKSSSNFNTIIYFFKRAGMFLCVFSPRNVFWLIAPYFYYVISRVIAVYLVELIDVGFLVYPFLIGSVLVSSKPMHIIINYILYTYSNVESQRQSDGYVLLPYIFNCTLLITLYLIIVFFSFPDLADLI